jgi:hypothetical protein
MYLTTEGFLMKVETKILSLQLSNGFLEGQSKAVAGITQLAADNGYETLSDAQKNVINFLLSQQCEGFRYPDGDRHDCRAMLSGEPLLNALENSPHYDAVLCESCGAQLDYISHHRDKIDRE